MFGKQRIVIGFGRHRTRRIFNWSIADFIDKKFAESSAQKTTPLPELGITKANRLV